MATRLSFKGFPARPAPASWRSGIVTAADAWDASGAWTKASSQSSRLRPA
jgi:hypothetical protein